MNGTVKAWRFDGEHRAGDLPEEALGRVADHDSGETRAAQRSHDQQINLIFTNASKKHLVGPADLVGKVNPNGLGQSLVLGLLQLVVQRLLSVSEDAAGGSRARPHRGGT